MASWGYPYGSLCDGLRGCTALLVFPVEEVAVRARCPPAGPGFSEVKIV